jgi:outer membrane protein assembly factor BamB
MIGRQGRSRHKAESRSSVERDASRASRVGRAGQRRAVTALLSVVIAVIGASVPIQVLSVSPASASTPGADWPGFLFSPGHSSYNAAATAITPANANLLGPAWNWLVPASPNTGRTNLFASPTVSNGVVYIGAEDGYFYAISEATHQRLWSKFLGILVEPPGECGGFTAGIISTATVANDPITGLPTVYVFGPDGYMYALNAATGATVWRGLVDSPVPGSVDYYSWSSPLVANGKVYVGISANCGNPSVPGGVSSLDQATGGHVAHWTSVAPGQVGATVWSSPGLAADGSILVTTGNACGTCSSTPLYNESIVKLNPTTLGLVDFWQIPPAQQSPDGDFGASPTSFSATINGVSTPMVGACNKGTGDFYAFGQNNLSAGPVWQVNMTIPYTANGANEQCDGAAIWNGTSLIVPGGAPTTLHGVKYTGSMQAFDPATGTPLWQTGLTGAVVGSPTEDGSVSSLPRSSGPIQGFRASSS